MPKDKNKIALSLEDIKKLLDSDDKTKKKKKRKKKKKDKNKTKHKGMTFEPIKHNPNMPNHVMSKPWNYGPSLGMRQDDTLRGELNMFNNKLAFNSDPHETKKLREQIKELEKQRISNFFIDDEIRTISGLRESGAEFEVLKSGALKIKPSK